MLRLKQAMNDCNIPQKLLCEATGFGKTQVSLTLSSGKLPADVDKFRQGVRTLINTFSSLNEWMECLNLGIDDLMETIPDATPAKKSAPKPRPADLECLLSELAGRAVLSGGSNTAMVRLATVTYRLLTALRDLAGHDAPYMVRLEADAVAVITGEKEASHG